MTEGFKAMPLNLKLAALFSIGFGSKGWEKHSDLGETE
jgi:hypothetical protein